MVCNGSFDMYVCWDYTAANTTAQASCPWYLPWYRHVAAGYVFRQCGSDGQWGPWRDHTQCENPEKNGAFQDQRLILERLQVVYTVGYSLSLGTLLLALLILSLFRCDPAPPAPRDGVETRASVYLRAELGDGVVLGEGPEEGGWRDSEDSSPGTPSPFVSQIPQAAALHSKLHPHERVLVFHASGGGHPHPGPAAAYPGSLPWGPDPYPAEPGPSRLPHGPDRDPVLRGCQLHLAAGRGCIPAPSAGDRGRLGKGPLPLLPASWLGGPRAFRHSLGDRQVPAGEHAVLGAQRGQSHLVDHSHPHPNNHLGRASLASSRLCSGISHSGEVECQPPVPPQNRTASGSVSLSSQINFFIFIRILGILVSKLRTRQMRCPDYRLRLARSTLTLVPLLGVHEVVFAPVTEEQAEGTLRFAKLAFEIFLSSFQGFLVSVLYCFINKEVGEAGLLAPPGGHAGNGAALSAPRCRCSRRSAGAGATASCISASGMSVPVRTRSSAPRPCPRVLHPGRSPSPAAPCPRGRCTGLERRSWKVTARGGANLKSWRTRFQANGIPREDALRTGKMEKGLRASPGDSRGLQMERWAGCGNWASSPGALKISSHFVYDCSARMDVCAPRARRKAFPMPEGQKIPWGWNSVSAARSAAEVSVSSCSTRTDYEGAGCEREARCEECRRLDQEGDHRAVMDLLRDAGRGIKGDCCDKHGDQRALGLGWECTERS
ncbi:gastric inhibitory polypeptide receptor isoform X2 [Mesocricetus auratus]|nr:gastric inhibitory polypeptide receptor isoform X2 [Mesocricetus auratus]